MSFRPAARQFFERRGAPTPPLPYDAEVEYLESTGTQRIDTGVNINDDNFVLECDMRSTVAAQSTAWARFFGSYVSETAVSTRLINNSTGGGLYGAYRCRAGSQTIINGTQLNTPYTTRKTYTLSNGNLRISKDSAFVDIVVSRYSGLAEDTSTVYLFGAKMACYGFKISHNGVLVRDLIPVRFTNELGQSEGAMYDRVSGQVFRNAGTGAFTIGPDK